MAAVSGTYIPVRVDDVDYLGMLPVNPDAHMLGIDQLPSDTPCRECGHALIEHDGIGECWYVAKGEAGEACSCWWFESPVQHDPLALEYIGAAFLVWSAARRETQELLWERDDRHVG